MLKSFNPREIHVRIASPQVKYPCYFGVDIPTKEELIANDKGLVDNKEISENVSSLVEADSLYYLKIESIKNIMKEHFSNLCSGCFDNNYNEFIFVPITSNLPSNTNCTQYHQEGGFFGG